MILASFAFSFICFVLIGLYAASKARGCTEDYLLASRSVSAPVAGISATASLMSGFMFIGYIGMVYKLGFYATYFFWGEVFGLLMLTPWAYKGIQRLSKDEGTQTYTGLLTPKNSPLDSPLAKFISLLTLIFLLIYASAQLMAGGKALNDIFGWPAFSGILLTAVVLLCYSYTGGIRSSIWTDCAQAVVMFIAMIALCYAGLSHIGGLSALYQRLYDIDPNLVSMSPFGAKAALLFAGGWLFIGLAIFAMPHVLIRYMVCLLYTSPSPRDA